ncbi:hypothetical protein V8E54_010937 [Elaphomyces granulatus]|jgi:hypothetical protein
MPSKASKGSTSRFGDVRANLSQRPSSKSSQQLQSSPPAEHAETQLDTASSLTAALAASPQVSIQPHEQQPQFAFGVNPQTPGTTPWPPITLDPSIREMAKSDPFLAAFVKSMDNLANGIV